MYNTDYDLFKVIQKFCMGYIVANALSLDNISSSRDTFKNKKIEQDKKETLPRTGQIDASNYLLGISIAGTILNTQTLRKKNTKNKKDNNK